MNIKIIEQFKQDRQQPCSVDNDYLAWLLSECEKGKQVITGVKGMSFDEYLKRYPIEQDKIGFKMFHASSKPYTSISNKSVEVIKNPDALAIWTFLQIKDSNWVVIGSWLQKHFGIGRGRYSKAMAHLEEMGLIHYETSRCDETGKLAERRRIVVNFEPKLAEALESPQLSMKEITNALNGIDDEGFEGRMCSRDGAMLEASVKLTGGKA